MKASTFFALIVAVLLGLAALASARYFGLFRPQAMIEPVAQPKTAMPLILAAGKNLYEGYAMLPGDVRVRPLHPHELVAYKASPAKYLPATVEAASLRVLKRNLEADQPLLQEYLEPQGIPEGLGLRLAPKMRAVHVSIPKERASGGMIRVGENVDVLMTTNINADHGKFSEPRTAVIARSLRVILKRDMLWTVLAPVPEDKPLQFTLEANPYRAALIEFARDKGQLTLQPTPTPMLPKDANPEAPISFSDPTSKEYKDEDERVEGIIHGSRSIGDGDLARIFGLPPIARPEQPIQVEIYGGNRLKGMKEYEAKRPATSVPSGLGYTFAAPPAVEIPPAAKTPLAGTPAKKK